MLELQNAESPGEKKTRDNNNKVCHQCFLMMYSPVDYAEGAGQACCRNGLNFNRRGKQVHYSLLRVINTSP